MAALLICGCTETGLFVDVTAPSALEALTVRVKDARRALATQTFPSPRLPGSVFVRLDDSVGAVTVVGTSSMPPFGGSANAGIETQRQKRVALTLSSTLVDTDADGWPDDVDDCPTIADADQLDADGDGRPEACSEMQSDAGMDAGVQLGGCDGGTFVSCVDFERPSAIAGFGDATWTRVNDVVARGRTALRVNRDAGVAGYAGRWVELGFAPFLRFHFRMENVSAPFTIADVNHATNGDGVFVFAIPDAGLRFTNRVSRMSELVAVPLEAGRWYCLELAFSGQPVSSTEVFVDGQRRQTASQVGSWVANRSLIGPAYDESEGGTVWIDDAASANARLGCQ